MNISLGTAVVGAYRSLAAFVIGSLTPSTTNHLYLLENGTGTANTTGTAPAASVKLGTCITGVATVTSVNTGLSSGRQQFQQPQSLVHGGLAAGITSAGHPRSVNLNDWAAAAAEGIEVYGVLPPGAVSGMGAASVVTKTGNYTLLYSDDYVLANATGGVITMTLPTAVGHSGQVFEVKRINTNANVVHVQTTSAQTIDGAAPPYDLSSPMAAAQVVSDGSAWWLV